MKECGANTLSEDTNVNIQVHQIGKSTLTYTVASTTTNSLDADNDYEVDDSGGRTRGGGRCQRRVGSVITRCHQHPIQIAFVL
jgi:hypothetical protein